jgi:cytochrome bd ubiquinol oxidase subunit I
MGLAPLIVVLQSIGLFKDDERYRQAARFWAKIFGISFVTGVVTGIPMEFQFGTNWAGFSKYAGAVIGQTLAMEGMFAFFLESAFIGALRLVLCRWSSLSLSYCAGDSSRSGCAGART